VGLLDRRLAALERLAAGDASARADLGVGPAERRVARRFLRSREGSWHDGDENRVRAYLDRLPARRSGSAAPLESGGIRPPQTPPELARALLEAAEDAAQGARPETLWFLLWVMEPALADLAAGVAGND
jgi:hypothetical protein